MKWSKIEHANQPNTFTRYESSCRNLKSYFGKVKVDRIQKKDIEKYIAWRSAQTSRKTKELVTRQSVNYDMFLLKMILKRLIDAKILHEDPARQIKQLKANEKQFHVLSKEQERLYLMACAQPLQDVAIIMLETGMRCVEVYQLRRQDVKLKQAYLDVIKGKTKSSIRRVHLSPKACDVLAKRLEKFRGEYLFPYNDIDGERLIRSLNFLHLKALRSLGFNFRLYDCRHTFATRALESGVDLLTLASILGHANLKMVSRYAHPSETRKADAIKQMGEVKNQAKAV